LNVIWITSRIDIHLATYCKAWTTCKERTGLSFRDLDETLKLEWQVASLSGPAWQEETLHEQ